jgi:hypothetical protein
MLGAVDIEIFINRQKFIIPKLLGIICKNGGLVLLISDGGQDVGIGIVSIDVDMQGRVEDVPYHCDNAVLFGDGHRKEVGRFQTVLCASDNNTTLNSERHTSRVNYLPVLNERLHPCQLVVDRLVVLERSRLNFTMNICVGFIFAAGKGSGQGGVNCSHECISSPLYVGGAQLGKPPPVGAKIYLLAVGEVPRCLLWAMG